MRRGGDVFSAGFLGAQHGIRQRVAGADFGQFDQHRQVDARDHLHALALHHGDREVGRRAPEHVGEEHHAIAGIAAADAFLHVVAAVLHIVIGTDADGIDVPLRAHHMFHGGSQFLGQTAVGDQDESDHRRAIVSLPAPA